MQLLALTLLALIASVTHAVTRHVPAEFAAIQAAILASTNGDTVLVAEGTYTENIDFRGRSIVVASHFLLDGDVDHIPVTTIDGSNPEHADSGSVVRIISGEDSTTALIGFTITGGTGTKFRDQSDNLFYVEGGGILIENSDPLIAFNSIVNNEATREPAGTQSAGGGGIRYGYCSPRIYNNVLQNNSGRYGGGIVSFFADGDLRNNVIAHCDGGQDYGGGGLWIGGNGHSTILINNTIVGNESVLSGGGIRLFAGILNGHSNIVWGNDANSGTDQIGGSVANIHVDYSCVEGNLSGTGNIDEYPDFQELYLRLESLSPCVDAGHPESEWNDEDGTRNDMGCYGGPAASSFFAFGHEPQVTIPQPYPLQFFDCDTVLRVIHFENMGIAELVFDSLVFTWNFPLFEITYAPESVPPFAPDSIEIYTPAAGGCVGGDDTLLIYHNDINAPNPLRIPLYLDPSGAADDKGLHMDFALHSAYPNPFNPSTTIAFALPSEQLVRITIYDIQGREVTQLVNSRFAAGEHVVEWNANRFSSGTYFATLRAGKWQAETKLTLIK